MSTLDGEDAYEHARRLTHDEIATRLCGAGLLEQMVVMVLAGLQEHNEQAAATSADLNVKSHMEYDDSVDLSVDERATAKPVIEPVPPDEVSCVCRGVRDGRVLRKQTILKADHYPSSHNKELPIISGAPNFRQASTDLPIFGVAMPTSDGLRSVCAAVAPEHQQIVWFNLRQEPCIYIHGRPFTVKERSDPFNTLTNKGLLAADVEQAEALLKLEVIAEARRFGGRLLVVDESEPTEAATAETGNKGGLTAQGKPFSYWETEVTGATVRTPREVMTELRGCVYHRLAISDGMAASEREFDAIVRHMREWPALT